MQKKGGSPALEMGYLWRVLGGLFFIFVLLYALFNTLGVGGRGYTISLISQINLGKTIVKNQDFDSGIVYLSRGNIVTDGNDVIINENIGYISRLGLKEIVVEKKNGVLRVFEGEHAIKQKSGL